VLAAGIAMLQGGVVTAEGLNQEMGDDGGGVVGGGNRK
jgi:hypothetical protein